MSQIKNPKRELFAQALAKGKSQAEAYELAGYKPDGGAASRLSGNVSIKARVSELLERGASSVELTVQTVAENLLRIAGKAEALGEASGFSVAKGAWMDAAKIKGLVIEKREVRTSIWTNYRPRHRVPAPR